MSRSRQSVVNLVRSWEGKNEADGSYKAVSYTHLTLPTTQTV